MPELNHLQFQHIDDDDDLPKAHRGDDDRISLDDQIDEDELEHYWDEVVEDIHEDPDWFTFANE